MRIIRGCILWISVVTVTFFTCTTENPINAGTGQDGEARVIGYIKTSSGQGVPNVYVELLDSRFNPAKQSTPQKSDSFFDVTNGQGKFDIEGVSPGTYTLFSTLVTRGSDSLQTYIGYTPSLTISESTDTTDIGNVILKKPGGLLLDLHDTLAIGESFLFIPGTRMYNAIDTVGLLKVTAPAGIVDIALYDKSNPQNDTGIILVDSITIQEDNIIDSTNVTKSIPVNPVALDSVVPYVGYPLSFSTRGFYYVIQSTLDTVYDVEYRFNWGDSTFSLWSTDMTAFHAWTKSGDYAIRAQGRGRVDTAIVSAWSNALNITINDTVIPDTSGVKKPNKPQPLDSVVPWVGYQLYFKTGGSYYVSDSGDTFPWVDYRFDWGDGGFSSWMDSDTGAHTWATAGDYKVRAQARFIHSDTLGPDTINDSLLSIWSDPLKITINDTTSDTLYILKTPTGPDTVKLGKLAVYSTEWVDSMPSGTVEYRFDWGDGGYSSWLLVTTRQNTWYNMGTYSVRAQARYVTDSLHVTNWSQPLQVTVIDSVTDTTKVDSISTPRKPFKWSDKYILKYDSSYIFYTWNTTCYYLGAYVKSGKQYRFDWGDGNISSWSLDTSSYNSWNGDPFPRDTTYLIRVQARSWHDTSIISSWSEPREVFITNDSSIAITTPRIYGVDSVLQNNDTGLFVAGGAYCSDGRPAEYRFEWGDSTMSSWIFMYDTTVSIKHSWSRSGIFYVNAQARNRDDTTILSDWSQPWCVRVGDSGTTDPMIIREPETPINVIVGDSVLMNIEASGTQLLRYQWQKRDNTNWDPVPGSESNAYYINQVDKSHRGEYRAIVWNDIGLDTSITVRLNVYDPDSIGVIKNPVNDTVYAGQRFHFSVGAEGIPPLVYQWQKRNGADFYSIPGATDTVYSGIANISDNGAWVRCIISMGNFSDTSLVAVLIVNQVVAPVITTQPNPLYEAKENDTISLTVEAAGMAPLLYQWERQYFSNWDSIPSATSNIYSIGPITKSDEGTYRVRVMNDSGVIISNSCSLHVTLNNTIQIYEQPINDTVQAGELFFFSISAGGSQPLSFQWQRRTDSLVFINIPNATDSSFSDTAKVGFDSTLFRCIVTASNQDKDTSDIAILYLLQKETKRGGGLTAKPAYIQQNEKAIKPDE